MKTQTIPWSEFPWQKQEETSEGNSSGIMTVLVVGTAVFAVMMFQPTAAVPVTSAPDADGWEKAKTSILHILDYVTYGVIVFSGGSWMFGHRNKALDLLLSCGIGTVIIRHADDIRGFFDGI